MGNQLLQTVPGRLLTGAPTASLSVWVRVNSHADLARSGGVRLFGDAGGKVSVGLSASGQLQASWSANDGAADHVSSWSQTLILGVNYHLAATWKDGAQQYYLNGLLVGADARRGALGKLGDAAPHPFRLGSDVAGVDVALDEPTLWVGHALTASEVGSLRDRVAAPSTIAPGSVALRWTLAGPDGGAATPGGAGLVDGSSSGLDLSSVVGAAPSYQSGHLAYSLLDQGCSAMVAPSGEGIIFKFHDAATNPANVTNVVDNDEQQSVTMSGNPSGGSFALGFLGQTTANIPAIPATPYASYRYVTTLPPGTYDLATNIPRGGNGDPSVLYQVFDGPTQVGTATLNQLGDGGPGGGAVNPAPFPDTSSPPLQQAGGSGTGNGVTISWYPLGRVTVASGNLSVLVSGSAAFGSNNQFSLDVLRVAPVGGGAVTLVPAAGANVASPNRAYYGTGAGYQAYPQPSGGGGMLTGTATGTATRYLFNPAAMQSALQSLSSIGTNNATASGDGSPQTPGLVKFVGALGDAPHPLMTCSDPAVVIARVAAGGILPSFRINGGTPIRLPHSWMFYDNLSPVMPTVEFFFPQAPPAVHYTVNYQYENTLENGTDGNWQLGTDLGIGLVGYTDQIRATAGSTPTATYRYGPLTAGTYRVSGTWPHGPGFTTSCTYKVYDVAGNLLGTYATDQTAAPPGATDQGVPWQVFGTFVLPGPGDNNTLTVVQSNGTGTTMVADAIRIERTSPDTSIRIVPGDVVTCSAGAGWATTVDGPAPAMVDVPATNLSGGHFYPDLPTTSTMKIGFNLEANDGNIGSFYYSNFMAASGLNGYPTDLGTSYYFAIDINHVPPVYGADRKSWANIPPGRLHLWWDGANDAALGVHYGTCVEVVSEAVITHGRNNHRVYVVGGSSITYGPVLQFIGYGTKDSVDPAPAHYSIDITNVRLYEDGVGPDNAPVFRPDFLAREANHQTGRYLDPLGTMAGNPTDFADFVHATPGPSRNLPLRTLNVPIHKIEPYTASPSGVNLDPLAGPLLLFTAGVVGNSAVAGPHGFAQGQVFGINNYGGPPIRVADDIGNSQDISIDGNEGYVWYVNSTQFVYQFSRSYSIDPADGSKHPYIAQTTLTDPYPAAYLAMSAGKCNPIADNVLRANANNSDFYANISVCATPACVTSLGDYLARHLNPGIKVRVAYCNETWNYSVNLGFYYTSRASHAYYGYGYDDPTAGTCEGSLTTWTNFEAGWVAAGRDVADVIRVLESQHFDAGVTGRRAAYCANRVVGGVPAPILFHEISTAPYFECAVAFNRAPTATTAFPALIDRLTVDQILDLWELYTTFGGYEQELPSHLAAVHAAGPAYANVNSVAYEGGPAGMIMPGGSGINRFALTHATSRHPRWFGIMCHLFRVYAESGCKAFHVFLESSIDSDDAWSAYQGTAQLPYVPGDPVQDAIQINQFDRTDLIKSVAGGAVNHFASLYLSHATPPTAHPPTLAKPRPFIPLRRYRPSH